MSTTSITVYWRPGCGFCARLLNDLDARDVIYERVNIWEDPQAAATVRMANKGNELVPTVKVGDVMLSNPPAALVVETAGG